MRYTNKFIQMRQNFSTYVSHSKISRNNILQKTQPEASFLSIQCGIKKLIVKSVLQESQSNLRWREYRLSEKALGKR